MMEVKGSGLRDTPNFVKEKFGEEAYKRWFSSLSPEAKKIFSNPILASLWYPFEYGKKEPIEKIVELFWGGDSKKAWEYGRYSADKLLGGIYKVFIKLGSPSFLVSKGSSVLGSIYKPTKLETVDRGDKFAIIRFTEFSDMFNALEYIFAGWIERALELSGCEKVEVKINASLARGEAYTEIEARWQ